MDARARRRRLPLAARIAAIPVLVAVAGGLAFGFTQSNAAQAPSAAAKKPTFNRAPVLPGGVDKHHLPRHRDLEVRLAVAFACTSVVCEGPTGNVFVSLNKGDGTVVKGYNVHLDGTPRPESPGSTTFITDTRLTIQADQLADGGAYTITHKYDGDTVFSGTEARTDNYTVDDKYLASWLVTSTPNPSRPGQEVTFTATYNGYGAPHKPTTKTALFAFQANDRAIGIVDLVDGNATFKTKNLPVGVSRISVGFSGDDDFYETRSFGDSHTVKKDPVATTTELTVTPNPIMAGNTLTLKATVTAKSGTAKPTGTMKFDIKNPEGGGFGSTVDLSADGTAETTQHLIQAGDFTVVAEYVPGEDFTASTSPETALKVTRAESTTAVTAKPQATGPGKPVTLTATVTPQAGVTLSDDGSISFTDGDTQLGTCRPQSKWTCEITTDKLAPGKHTVTATFDGGHAMTTSSGTTSIRVFQGSTTKLTAGPSPVTVGSAVTLNAKVGFAEVSTPFSGKVTFLDGTTELGKGDVDKDGKATLSTSNLTVGTHSLTARFEGSDALDPSTSEQVTVRVDAASTPGQGGGSQSGGSTGGSQNGAGGSNPQPKNLARSGANIAQPIGIGAVLLILGAVAITFGRRRVRKSR